MGICQLKYDELISQWLEQVVLVGHLLAAQNVGVNLYVSVLNLIDRAVLPKQS